NDEAPDTDPTDSAEPVNWKAEKRKDTTSVPSTSAARISSAPSAKPGTSGMAPEPVGPIEIEPLEGGLGEELRKLGS
ncbi:MAG TPA: hypothetical protein VMZ27_15550, partial [Candidatus Saccharimonadales bacterium]|nr:hypothetical protein [Candidatus Saccharimonadales bacterium]